MIGRRVRTCDDASRGDTLVEVLLAVLIVGLSASALLLTFSEGITMSGVHRRLSTTDIDARAFADKLSADIDARSLPYTPCAAAAAYSAPPGFAPTAGDTVSITAVKYWDGAAFGTSCSASTDTGIQRLDVTVTNTDTRATRVVQVIVRKPCSLADVTAGPCT